MKVTGGGSAISSDIIPSGYNTVSSTLSAKIGYPALTSYTMREFPFPRNVTERKVEGTSRWTPSGGAEMDVETVRDILAC